MSHFFSRLASAEGFASAALPMVFDAEQSTPELVDAVARRVPGIRYVMASLRESLPLAPHSGVGPIGRSGFFRIPNHYRSVSFMLPSIDAGSQSSPGAIVFKGTEPLLGDFPEYFDWMLSTPFRASPLPLALHFPLDMKLPPSAMWIEECIAEQAVSSRVQQLYMGRYGRLARLPLPLFVFRMTPKQNARYEEIVRSRLSDDALRKIKNKLADGLGVEIYYYPELPVRVADLAVGQVRETFKAALGTEQVEETVDRWTQLMAEMLCLEYMPYASWHHGMGGCVDPGNVCIDGGFNDLLTLVPFDAIPDESLFRNSLQLSIKMLADSTVTLVSASIGMPLGAETEAGALAVSHLTRSIREYVLASQQDGRSIDERLKRFFDPPGIADVFNVLRKTHQARSRQLQFLAKAEVSTALLERVNLKPAAGA
jgi:hypothetical protein